MIAFNSIDMNRTKFNIGFRSKKIILTPMILSVKHEPVFVFSNKERLVEYKEVRLLLNIKINDSETEIPFLVLLSKYLKNEGVNYSPTTNLDQNIFNYRMIRALNARYSDFMACDEFETLFHVLQIFQINNNYALTSTMYNNISASHLLNKHNLECLNMDYRMKYIIRRCRHILPNDDRIANDYYSKINFIEVPKTQELYNIVPFGFSASYSDSFESIKNNQFRVHAQSIWETIYHGTYSDCISVFLDLDKFEKLRLQILKDEDLKRQKESADDADYYYSHGWKEDYYNAMSDGQFGDYNDSNFDMDELDTWSNG